MTSVVFFFRSGQAWIESVASSAFQFGYCFFLALSKTQWGQRVEQDDDLLMVAAIPGYLARAGVDAGRHP
jgi:hypothetical protein